jgi:hypothetical protein
VDISDFFRRPLYYNHDGEPISLDDWGRLMDIPEYRMVGNDYIHVRGASYRIEHTDAVERAEGIVRVSTVWLGLDHNLFGPPHIFETMIFGGAHDGTLWRYSSHAEAVTGHAAAVELVRREAHAINQLREAASPAPEPPSTQ